MKRIERAENWSEANERKLIEGQERKRHDDEPRFNERAWNSILNPGRLI